MVQVFRSGAFLQQCWSVHPLCLTVKRVTDGGALVLTCSSCKSSHHLSLTTVVSKDSVGQEAALSVSAGTKEQGDTLLGRCIAGHHAMVTLREMDVFQDLVLLRCAECRRQYELTVSSFETHQR